MSENGYTRYRLINYFDVWGNEDDGWEINNQCEEFNDLYISDDASGEELIDYLKKIEFFTEKANIKTVEVDYSATPIIEFRALLDGENLKPLCALIPFED